MAERDNPVAPFTTVTLACEMPAPVVSLTRPWMVTFTACPCRVGAPKTAAIAHVQNQSKPFIAWAFIVPPLNAPNSRTRFCRSVLPGTFSVHHPHQAGLGIIEVLRQKRCTLLQFSGGQQLIDPAVHRNQAARIVVAAVYQHHAHSQFPNHPLVKRLQSPILVETYEQAVELQIELHCACPIAVTHGALIAF